MPSIFVFNKKERAGILALCCIIFVMVAFRALIPFTEQQQQTAAEKKLQGEFNRFLEKKRSLQPSELVKILPVNINTADSLSLVLLPGIGSATAKRVLEKTGKGYSFKTSEEFLDFCRIQQRYRDALKARIVLADSL